VNIKDPFSEKIENAKNKGDYDVLLKALEEALKKEPGNTVLLEKRAKLHEKFQQYGKAINDYKSILDNDPENKFAKSQIELLKTILRYSNTDIYASTNTNMDPWLE
jgi:tetratricopeptide (TPR) repeat protein